MKILKASSLKFELYVDAASRCRRWGWFYLRPTASWRSLPLGWPGTGPGPGSQTPGPGSTPVLAAPGPRCLTGSRPPADNTVNQDSSSVGRKEGRKEGRPPGNPVKTDPMLTAADGADCHLLRCRSLPPPLPAPHGNLPKTKKNTIFHFIFILLQRFTLSGDVIACRRNSVNRAPSVPARVTVNGSKIVVALWETWIPTMMLLPDF